MLVEGAEFHQGVIPVERNAGPALLADEGLRVFGNAFQQVDVSTVAFSISASQHLSLSVFSFYPPVFLRRFARVVGGGLLGSFLATGQQAPCFSKRGLPLFLLTFPGLQIILECR
jgi:hypothetical protein